MVERSGAAGALEQVRDEVEPPKAWYGDCSSRASVEAWREHASMSLERLRTAQVEWAEYASAISTARELADEDPTVQEQLTTLFHWASAAAEENCEMLRWMERELNEEIKWFEFWVEDAEAEGELD